MRSLSSFTRCILLLALAAPGVSLAAGGQAGPPTTPPGADNYYAAGNHVEISAPMPRDVVVAGREIDIRQTVAGDILAAGWRVALTARADDDVRIAAGTVIVNAPVKGDLTVAGGDVTVGEAATISGRSWITGRIVRIQGTAEREMRVAGADVTLSGELRQPVEIVADRLEITPSARVLAPLRYKGASEPVIGKGAIVNGPITYDKIARRDVERARAFPVGSTVLFSIHVLFAGWLVLMLAPRVEASVVDTLRRRPGRSLLLGFALFFSTPAAAILLVVSVMGMPLGFVLAAVYAVALFAAVLATAFFVGDAEAKLLYYGPVTTRGQQVAMLAAGVLTLALLRAAIGSLVVFASIVFGLGALALTAYGIYQRPAATPLSPGTPA